MKTRAKLVVVLGGVAAAGVSGCASDGGGPGRPARISHVVFFELEEAGDRDALIADCEAKLSAIPGVVSFAAGRHLDVGRASVLSDYDVGLYIGFETEADYAAYVTHPLHVELVEAWKDRTLGMRVFDVVDETE